MYVCTCVWKRVCLWVLSITPQGNWSPRRPFCNVKEQTTTAKISPGQLFKAPPLRAAILERLAWAEIAALWSDTHSQVQMKHPLFKKERKRGYPMAGQDIHPMSVKGWISLEFWACSRTFCLLHFNTSSSFKVFCPSGLLATVKATNNNDSNGKREEE